MSTVDHSGSTSSAVGSTRAELVNRAVALQPLVRKHATTAEADRRLSDEVDDALTQAGLFRLLTPRRYGGYQADLRTVVEVTEALGEADGSASWVVSVASVANWFACLCSEQAQREIFGSDPDARVAGGFTSTPATRVDGGVRVSGHWAYVSGSWHATWVMLGVPLTDEAGHIVDAALAVVPASELALRETWFTAGMKATGSNTFVGEDVFAPGYRVMKLSAVADGNVAIPTDEALFRLPFGPLAAVPLLGPLLGIGRATLAWTIEKAATKPLTHTVYSRQADSVGSQVQIAEAALKIETARLHTYSAVDEIDSAALLASPLDYAARARIKAQGGYAAQQILDGINILLNVHGAGSFAESNPMQRYWRDANTGARHAALNSAVGYEIFGKSLLAVDERISAVI